MPRRFLILLACLLPPVLGMVAWAFTAWRLEVNEAATQPAAVVVAEAQAAEPAALEPVAQVELVQPPAPAANPTPTDYDEYADEADPPLIFDPVCSPEEGGSAKIGLYDVEVNCGAVHGDNGGAHRMKEALKIIGNHLAVDGNRDGNLTFDAADRKTTDHPWRWWINDDKDEANVDIDSGADVPGSGANSTDAAVNGRRDLVDFFPVGIDLNGLRQAFPPSDGYTLQLRQADGAINVVPVNHVVGSAFDYLTQEQDGGYGSGFGQAARSASVTAVTSAGVAMPTEINQLWQSNNASAVMLVEGRGATKKPLELVVSRGEMSVVVGRIELSISPVENMYRWVNLRNVVNPGGPTSRLGSPENMPDNECNDVTVVWVHGYNVQVTPARAWMAESYKRLYQSRMRAKFAGVTWAGDIFNDAYFGIAKAIAADYHLAVENAFKSSAAFADAVRALPGRKILISHSLGAGVVGGAIQDANLTDFSKYIAIDAAMPKEVYDEFAPIDPKMIPSDGYLDNSWHNDQYTTSGNDRDALNPKLWSPYWYKKFPQGDSRSGLGWRGRLGNVVGKMYNMYSDGEEVLKNSDGTWPNVLSETAVNTKVWQSQEWLKGNASVLGVIFIHNAHGGWGFNTRHRISTGATDDVVGGQYRYSTIEETWFPLPVTIEYLFEKGYAAPMGDRVAAELNSQSDAALIHEPYFKRFDTQSSIGSIGDPHLSYLEKNRIMAQAIPSTTFAAGANPLDNVDGYNLDSIRATGSWPQGQAYANHQRWFHSDIKDVAYLYVHAAFDHILDVGEAR